MSDIMDAATRSRLMSRIRGKNTKPELRVRRYLHAQGLRFKLHDHNLPGKPDLVFPKYRTVVFVHGCFWHRHKGCPSATSPKSRAKFWEEKLEGNVLRDAKNAVKLQEAGWRVLTIWECESASASALASLVEEIRADEHHL